jgi:hypothetical protein
MMLQRVKNCRGGRSTDKWIIAEMGPGSAPSSTASPTATTPLGHAVIRCWAIHLFREAFPTQLVEPAGNAVLDLSPFLVLPEVQRLAEPVGTSVAPVAGAAAVQAGHSDSHRDRMPSASNRDHKRRYGCRHPR